MKAGGENESGGRVPVGAAGAGGVENVGRAGLGSFHGGDEGGPGGVFPSWGRLYGVVVAYGVAMILFLAVVTWLAERWIS